MTSQQFLVCDSSTLANFKQWAQAISNFFSTAGWTQTSDTGQVDWSTITTVPGFGAFEYEIWQPGDGLADFFVKVQYGNLNSTNVPSIRLTISTTTDGAGTATGFIMGPRDVSQSGFAPPSTSTQYECNFSGDAGRMCVMMWRNAPSNSNAQQLFAIERSIDATGTYTSSYVTLITAGQNTSNTNVAQQSLVLGVGPTQVGYVQGNSNYNSGLCVRTPLLNGSNTTAFNGSIPFDTAAPCVGFFDYPCTSVGVGYQGDFAEGVPFTATLYAVTHTYMPSKNGVFTFCWPTQQVAPPTQGMLCMRYD